MPKPKIAMKLLVAFILTIGANGYGFAQPEHNHSYSGDHYQHAVFAEIIGIGGLLSLNYTNLLIKSKRSTFLHGLSTSIGIGYTPELFEMDESVRIPASMSYVFGKRKLFLEIGGYATPIIWTHYNNTLLVGGIIGVEFLPITSSLVFKLRYTPIFKEFDDLRHPNFIHLGGLGIGLRI